MVMIRKDKRLLHGNHKLAKGGRYLVRGLSLAPGNLGGHEVCPARGACFECGCLWQAGFIRFPQTRQAMIDRTRDLYADRRGFVEQLGSDLSKLADDAAAQHRAALVRWNLFSDLVWEGMAPRLLDRADDLAIGQYDYTKLVDRWRRQRDRRPNYHLTYSYNERSRPSVVADGLADGLNVSVAVDLPVSKRNIDRLPDEWRINGRWWPAVAGDRHDYRRREVDGSGVVVLLTTKGGPDVLRDGVRGGFIQPTYMAA